jgi:chromosome segregation ATPase
VLQLLTLQKHDPDVALTQKLYQELGERISAKTEHEAVISEVQTQKALIASTTTQFEESQIELRLMATQLSDTKAELAATVSTLANKSTETAQVISLNAELETRLQRLHAELNCVRDEQVAVRRRCLELDTDKRRHVTKLAITEGHLADMRSQVDTLEHKCQLLSETNRNDLNEKEQLRSELTVARAESRAP